MRNSRKTCNNYAKRYSIGKTYSWGTCLNYSNTYFAPFLGENITKNNRFFSEPQNIYLKKNFFLLFMHIYVIIYKYKYILVVWFCCYIFLKYIIYKGKMKRNSKILCIFCRYIKILENKYKIPRKILYRLFSE